MSFEKKFKKKFEKIPDIQNNFGKFSKTSGEIHDSELQKVRKKL